MIRKVEVELENGEYEYVDLEIYIEDVLEYIDSANAVDKHTILEKITVTDQSIFDVDNLYDREKVLILKDAMKKYNLNELIEKLQIIQGEAL